MANRRCYKCGIRLDGGKGVIVVKFDWKEERWVWKRSYCDRCFGVLETEGSG
jgi:hypothetical protein